MSVALYPGSFDPIHNGHLSVLAAVAPLFDQVIIGVGHNPDKPSGMFAPRQRIEMIEDATAGLTGVTTALFSGLVTDAAKDLGADCLVKGLRNGSDLDAEMQQAHMNLTTGGVPTLFAPGTGDSALVASTYVRQIAMMGGDVTDTVPALVAKRLSEVRDR